MLSFSAFLQQLRLDLAKIRNQELHPCLLLGWQELMDLSHHLLPARVRVSRKSELRAEPGLQPKYHNGGCG